MQSERKGAGKRWRRAERRFSATDRWGAMKQLAWKSAKIYVRGADGWRVVAFHASETAKR